MNKTRRKALNAVQDRLTALNLDVFRGEIESIRDEMERLCDEEQEAFDNLPESVQQGERGSDMQYGLDALKNAFDTIDAIFCALEPETDPFEDIETAKGPAE